jgi:hypothetical protein
VSDELAHRRGREADAVLVVLDFLGDADLHGCSVWWSFCKWKCDV